MKNLVFMGTKMKTFKLLLLVAVSCFINFASMPSQAAIIFVGQWEVDDGPNWTTNPAVYSGQEAAALLFGGSPSDYVISTIDSNPSNVDNLAWYSIWGVPDGTKFAEDYHFDLGGPGYNDLGTVGSAASAYVDDNATGSAYTNYAFRVDDVAAVPEPASLTLWGLGALGCAIAGYRRRKAA